MTVKQLKIAGFDPQAEYTDEDRETRERFAGYQGPVPPKGLMLLGSVERCFYKLSQAGNPMFVTLFRASQNEGADSVYNGLTVWANVLLSPEYRWSYFPFLEALDLKPRDLTRLVSQPVTRKDGSTWDEILKVSNKIAFPATVGIKVGVGEYNGVPRCTVADWINPSVLVTQSDELDADLEDADLEDDEPAF